MHAERSLLKHLHCAYLFIMVEIIDFIMIKKDKITMKQLPSDKYNIAWFKLAEFVARGEKERALGIYRLLIHSFNDKALAAQLAGDLFLAFNDRPEAHIRYCHAAELYVLDGRLRQAAAVFEHVIALDPARHEYVRNVFRLYIQIPDVSRAEAYLELIMKEMLRTNSYEEHMSFIEQCVATQQALASQIYAKMALLCITHHAPERPTLLSITKAIHLLAHHEHTQELNNFLHALETLHISWYNQAYALLVEAS